LNLLVPISAILETLKAGAKRVAHGVGVGFDLCGVRGASENCFPISLSVVAIRSLGSAYRMKTWTLRVPDALDFFRLFEQRKVFDRHEIQIKHFKPFDPALYHRAGFLGARGTEQGKKTRLVSYLVHNL
jgi:hypothetical protein